jgi:hypothetical protein
MFWKVETDLDTFYGFAETEEEFIEMVVKQNLEWGRVKDEDYNIHFPESWDIEKGLINLS